MLSYPLTNLVFESMLEEDEEAVQKASPFPKSLLISLKQLLSTANKEINKKGQ